jgi:hypothetical protein
MTAFMALFREFRVWGVVVENYSKVSSGSGLLGINRATSLSHLTQSCPSNLFFIDDQNHTTN